MASGEDRFSRLPLRAAADAVAVVADADDAPDPE